MENTKSPLDLLSHLKIYESIKSDELKRFIADRLSLLNEKAQKNNIELMLKGQEIAQWDGYIIISEGSEFNVQFLSECDIDGHNNNPISYPSQFYVDKFMFYCQHNEICLPVSSEESRKIAKILEINDSKYWLKL